ncbi:5'-deoxynucleotidase HDDC2-like isoform X2 [Amphibalanus amphitrite]|nr:5'-deoxynucleotidase HDDC2-like isoform X2 [Amphibalanus amphitrite]XP_043195812.1 5'-deoxynucleotidase HDDC2-like isoform X2 [Amphibalanus amphitrite]XP_043195813.1 5'-deoxynucleotidase HDDC2-like isoform X2 [Amphibalanus amphitrite]XP_043195814.1 5'-deoxynucleotidase HDDC2-like isoform X2 [Amphibalanus amphitrite]XP_043195815.1 5'-deoxynucleotidase HDDC2-like isoform X2 [Amphibalanus amphitrite]XP_043213750.1 5'-deoxynucleotidase HDDC2-like isoform X2 [Amphibalanus amphitrite]XP_04321375
MAANSLEEHRKLLDFFRIVGKLKHLKRTGWVRCDVTEPETVAGHMYRMSIMAMVAAGRAHVDQTRAVKMALVHDLAEALAGDITPHCGVSDGDKHARELAALETMVQPLDDRVASEIMALFVEYESNQTAEARFVHDLDKLDMILQADEYEAAQGRDLQQFFDSTREVFRTEEGQGMAAVLRRQRDERRRTGDGGATAETPAAPGTNAD